MRAAVPTFMPLAMAGALAAALAPAVAPADVAASPAPPTPAAPAAPDGTDDRIALSLDGATLTNSDGGGGGSATWLHNFDPQTLAGIAVEHQGLANSQWTFGSVNGSLTRGDADHRYSLYGEAHEGAGDDGSSSFHYRIEALGVIGSYYRQFSWQLEDREIDVLKSRGNLPKVGVAYQWNPHIATSVSFADTVEGNLGTRLTTVRIDAAGPGLSYLAGAAFGQASPAVLNEGGINLPGSTLREGYVGVSKPFPALRGDLTAVLDYIDLYKPQITDSKHVTLTVSYIFHVGHR
jgi:hypothetical protein